MYPEVDVCGQIGARLVINCVHIWNLGSASGGVVHACRPIDMSHPDVKVATSIQNQAIAHVCGQIGTTLVFNCVCLWNLGSASSLTCRSVNVCAGIGMRLIINCVHMWNLGSASGVT